MTLRRVPILGALIAWAAMAAGPASAQVVLPAGCAALATVVHEACTVSTVMQCADGNRIDQYVDGEPNNYQVLNAGWGLMGYGLLNRDDVTFRTVPGSGTSASIDTLIATGMTEGRFDQMVSTGAIRERLYSVVETHRLSDDTVEFGGTTWRRGTAERQFNLRGNTAFRFVVDIYVSEEDRILVLGAYTRQTFGGTPERVAATVRDIILPGRPGFLSSRSPHGCDG
ncbi:MAG: hypothetical protein NXH82_13460 [Rhodobacteraceae bacterium]|nr:hypothetical protein [Paracoccaceae bacterium]